MMKERQRYILAFILLLGAEVLIALFVRDQFVRPYVGDVLVAVLLCCLLRIAIPKGRPLLPLWVFLFCAFVEASQYLNLVKFLHLEDTVFSVILGSVFDWKDILCYGVGCLLFYLADQRCNRQRDANQK